MKSLTKYYLRLKSSYVVTLLAIAVVSVLFVPNLPMLERTGNNMFSVTVNGINVGTVADTESIDELVMQARREVAGDSDEMVFINADVRVEGREVLAGFVDSSGRVRNRIMEVLKESTRQTLRHSYTVKINEFTVNLANSEEVLALLEASIDKYDISDEYTVEVMLDPTRELNVLTTEVKTKEEAAAEEEKENNRLQWEAGSEAFWSDLFDEIEPEAGNSFDDFAYGLKDLNFGDTIEIVESYLLPEQITSLEEAINQVTRDQEKNTIYEVVSGDTLGGIAFANDLTIEELVEMNPSIENENSTIRVEDEIIVTIPEPELSILTEELMYYEENYDEDVIYVDRDDWYITELNVTQQPSAGQRKVAAVVNYRNDNAAGTEIVKEEVTMQAVPKIVERGTKVPPTYIKPLSGGRLSSNYGGRSAPVKGASTYHKGTDWATPTGTAVMASSSGTVTKAGWGSGYGYCVYIQHADGKETRYGHLSKVLVKAGQKVKQGEKIALSGNTGRSSGPHVHFEIRINGTAVNPLKYLN